MLILLFGILALLFGYLLYSKLLQKSLLPLKEPTPAISKNDNVDFVPMSRWRNQLIQLLNIAGTGPIFGALMGAKWGPIVFLWIIIGTIFGGAVHDYYSGMMSARNNGGSINCLMSKYLGKHLRYPLLIFLIFLMIMVSATFAKSASDLLTSITDVPFMVWMVLILVYFVASTILPINKLIGRIYPVFGILLILMAVIVIAGLFIGGYEFPAMTLENQHPNGDEFFPDMFITVACGAISGFHATQSPMVARCIKDEKDGRMVFYGAMAIESVIALIWAIAALAFYGDTGSLADALAEGGSAGVVYDISVGVAGSVGSILAILGVIICPITSGDTALRSARMMVQDDRDVDNSNKKTSLIITGVLMAFIFVMSMLDFSVLWNYFSWMNQTLACIVLWTATAFLLKTSENRLYSLIPAIPAMFMTMVTSSFLFHSKQFFGLDYSISMMIATAISVTVMIVYLRALFKARKGTATE